MDRRPSPRRAGQCPRGRNRPLAITTHVSVYQGALCVPAIYVENLSKLFRVSQKDPGIAGAVKALVRPRYQEKVAVDCISFTVEPGEVVGYIGVNGAGKSTTI